MPYSAEISRANPTCFLFLIDQSKSMLGSDGRPADKRKAEAVADAINSLLYTLVLRCVWGRPSSTASTSASSATAAGRPGARRRPGRPRAGADQRAGPRSHCASSSESRRGRRAGRPGPADGELPRLVRADRRRQDAHVRRPSSGPTTWWPASWPNIPTASRRWSSTSPTARPPTATRTGRRPRPRSSSSDGRQRPAVQPAHLREPRCSRSSFRTGKTACRTIYARRLFRMSSPLPPPMHGRGARPGFMVNADTRGFVFNADLASVVRFLDIGTRVGIPRTSSDLMTAPGLSIRCHAVRVARGGHPRRGVRGRLRRRRASAAGSPSPTGPGKAAPTPACGRDCWSRSSCAAREAGGLAGPRSLPPLQALRPRPPPAARWPNRCRGIWRSIAHDQRAPSPPSSAGRRGRGRQHPLMARAGRRR